MQTNAVDSGSQNSSLRHEISGKSEYTYLIFLSWMFLGSILDAFVHFHIGDELESFFTPSHMVLYSGGAAASSYLIYLMIKNRGLGYSTIKSIPIGYELAFLGIIFFVISGVGDGIWHTLYGIEEDVEAMYSPTHLVGLAAAMFLFTSIIRARIVKNDSIPGSWKDQFPTIISFVYISLMISLFTVPFQPYYMNWMLIEPSSGSFTSVSQTFDASYVYQAIGMAGFLVFSLTITIPILVMANRFALPKGAIFVYFFSFGTFLSIINKHNEFLPSVIISAILIEVIFLILKPSSEKPYSYQIFTLLLNLIVSGTYVLTIILFFNSWWTIHLIAGAPFLAAIFTTALSFLLIKPET